MELECVESLGPDPVPLSYSYHESFTIPPPKSLHAASSPHFPAVRSIPHSPLTRSPSPSPKRRRIACDVQPALPPTNIHPLARLRRRDASYVLRRGDHLANTPVTSVMREEVVAWCADMVSDLSLPEAVAAIAVNLFDRFVERHPVRKGVLYALTASSLLLACKLALDERAPHDEISSRARVSAADMHAMEAVILNGLDWKVNVVTPHEVVQELAASMQTQPSEYSVDRMHALRDSLMLNALLDYELAALHATSIGVASYILGDSVAAGSAYADHTVHDAYQLARRCGVDLFEVDKCICRLRAGLTALFEDIEDVYTDEDTDDETGR